MSKPPLLQMLAFDPILANVKLIAEAWDCRRPVSGRQLPALEPLVGMEWTLPR